MLAFPAPLRLLVQWPRLGPYHLARLRALGAAVCERGGALIGLETATHDDVYAWREHKGNDGFERHTVFSGRTAEQISPHDVWWGVRRALDRLQPDALIINSYSHFDALACLAWARTNRRVAVCATDSRAEDGPRHPIKEALKRRLVRQFDAGFVAGTPHVAYLASLGISEDRISVGCDVVDNGYFAREAAAWRKRPRPDQPGLADSTPFFLVSARFIAKKNLPALVEAYARYRAASPEPWRLVVLGDGPLRNVLEQQAASVAPGAVTLAGFRQIEDLPAYYAHASALVLPSTTEQWGLVVNEAMASGLPVLVSNCAGCAADLVDEGVNGWTFDPHDVQAIAAALTRLSNLPPEDRAAMGSDSQRIVADWGLERYASGALEAVGLGANRAKRGLSLDARLLLGLMRRTARNATSFHSHVDA